ncbi:MAG: LssY C-terminal domain-containing protein [Curvibacter sp.]|nr:LssY C-terminal domain-containing protein [Curvibacter sp.]
MSPSDPPVDDNAPPPARRWRRLALLLPLLMLALYLLGSYVALPQFWRSYEKHHPALAEAERRAQTAVGIPGDPINLAFVGTEQELLQALKGAGWVPADPITWGSSVKIAVDSLAHRAYLNAPVSDLFVWHRKQDMAFEQAFGPDPSRRHHVRFWRSQALDEQGRPLWLAAATFDRGVGVSHLTGQVTHHIDGDVDKERDKLAADLARQPTLAQEWLSGFQLEMRGRNGGGDPYFTDGRLCVIRVAPPPGDLLGAAQQFFAPVLDLLSGRP